MQHRGVLIALRTARLAVCPFMVVAGLFWTGATSAPAAGLSSQLQAPAITLAGGYLSQLACGSASVCTAVEPNGATLTFNPGAAGAVTQGRPIHASGGVAISCPSAALCAEADASGQIATFAPRRPLSTHTFTMTGADYQTAVDCAAVSSCVADSYMSEVGFDPRHPGKPASTAFTANANGANPNVSCPATSYCVADNGNSDELSTFAPSRAATAKVSTLKSTLQLGGIHCTSHSFCVALAAPQPSGGANTAFVTFNPADPGNPKVHGLSESTLEFMTCLSATLCAAAGNQGGVLIFDPKTPGHVHLISTTTDLAGIAFAGRSLVLLALNGTKAVVDPTKPLRSAALVGLNKAITHG